MEDFGSIIWTVVLIGFAIFSVVAKGREKQAKQQHQEAWPSWDEDSDAEKALEAQNAEEGRMSEHYESAETSGNYESVETYQEEAQSLEVIPEREYASLEESSTAMSGSLNPNTATQVSGRNAFVNTAANAFRRDPQASMKADPDEIHDNIAQGENTEDLTLDFDLRKAVIYSEIMKPKFEE